MRRTLLRASGLCLDTHLPRTRCVVWVGGRGGHPISVSLSVSLAVSLSVSRVLLHACDALPKNMVCLTPNPYPY